MDSDGFSCMQSQHTSTGDHNRYNKSTCENCMVTRISPVSIYLHANSSVKYK